MQTDTQIIPAIPFSDAWQADNKQWLKDRKAQWKIYLEREKAGAFEPIPREVIRAEKHFLLTGERPEQAGIRYKSGHPIFLGLSQILPLHPLQRLDVWLALFAMQRKTIFPRIAKSLSAIKRWRK